MFHHGINIDRKRDEHIVLFSVCFIVMVGFVIALDHLQSDIKEVTDTHRGNTPATLRAILYFVYIDI